MESSLQNQVIVVTGGAVRLGRAIALACAQAGASVVIGYHTSATEAKATVRDLEAVGSADAKFAAVRADVTRSAEVDSLADEVQRLCGHVDGLVNSAAIFRRTPFVAMTEADFDDHVATNLKGPYLVCKRFGDIFLAQGGGSIINIADIFGLKPLKNYIPYCVSKAGVVMLTEALALALAPNVRVNCICPGTVLPPSEPQGESDDEAALVRRIPYGRLGSPEEIAATAVFLLGGPHFITGAVLPVDGAQRLR